MALLEIVVGIDNLDSGLKVYQEGLGLTLLERGELGEEITAGLWGWPGGAEVARLGRPDVADSVRIRLVAAVGQDPPSGRAAGDTRTTGSLGIGFTTQGIHGVRDGVAATGVRFLSEPVVLTPEPDGPTGPQRFEVFGQAPSSEFIVLIERRNVPTPYGSLSAERPVSEPLHTSHVVTDLTHCSRFMSRVLGHEGLFREKCEGEEFDRLMDVEPGTRFWFEMLGHPDHPTGRIIFIEYDDKQTGRPQAPPTPGISGLAYSCDDLDATLARAAACGVVSTMQPVEVDDPLLGRGRVVTLQPPWGSLLELWEGR